MQVPVNPIDVQEFVDKVIDAVNLKIASIALFVILFFRYGKPVEAYRSMKAIVKDKTKIEKAVEENREECTQRLQEMESKLTMEINQLRTDMHECILVSEQRRTALNEVHNLAMEVESMGDAKRIPNTVFARLFKALSKIAVDNTHTKDSNEQTN